MSVNNTFRNLAYCLGLELSGELMIVLQTRRNVISTLAPRRALVHPLLLIRVPTFYFCPYSPSFLTTPIFKRARSMSVFVLFYSTLKTQQS